MDNNSLPLFVIDGHDFTSLIKGKTYKVNDNDVYVTWTDGRHIERRDVVRTKTSGTFTLIFQSLRDYNLFISLMRDRKEPGGYFRATFYQNNKKNINLGDYYIDFELPDDEPFINVSICELEITVTER